jgi:hypothetical protein
VSLEEGDKVTHSPVWPGSLATLAIVALLMTFQQVVSGAVRDGQSRRIAVALHADAVWRCNTLHGSSLRDGCVAQLDAGPRDQIALATPVTRIDR